MKQFLAVLRFELENYFKNKSYIITTAIISLLLIVGVSLPNFIEIPGISKESSKKEETDVNISIYDKNNILGNMESYSVVFPNVTWNKVNSYNEVKESVENKEAESGIIINSNTDYTYIVNNKSFSDDKEEKMKSILTQINRDSYFASKGIDVTEAESIINTPIESNVEVLGKDSVSSFAYTYVLIFIIYMMVIMYGQLIAVSVTTEKSNRAMEILVTSTSTDSLIFGKVIAGAIASFIQVAIILASGLITYSINGATWGETVAKFMNIPAEVLIVYGVFGVIGFIFYAFIFGALGALVSKTEDISKSIGPVSMIFVVVFLLVMANLTNSDSTLMKVLSFVPFSSCIAMFVRVAMGTVKNIEVIISLLILVASTGIVGVIGSKIYRMATLMYGNPIKITSALKWLKK